VDWHSLKFGVEIEFVGGCPREFVSLPGWVMSLDEHQIDENGEESGSELKPSPITWEDRGQIIEMLDRLRQQGAIANWSCGLHVHVGLEPWGEAIVLPLIDAAIRVQEALRELLCASEHRLIFCPPVTEAMRERYVASPGEDALRNPGRPQSHRCGINTRAWFDVGTVEIRYANGSLDSAEVLNTIELCLRFVATVGAGRELTPEPNALAAELAAPPMGSYPVAAPAPRWYRERMQLEQLLIPLLAPLVEQQIAGGEILSILPSADGFLVTVEKPDGALTEFVCQPPGAGWELVDR
jgi:hypothetical protein